MTNIQPNTKQLRVKQKINGTETLAYEYDGDFIATGGVFYCPEWVENSFKRGAFKFVKQGDMFMENPAVRKGYPPDFGLVEPGDYIIKCVGIEYAYYFVKKDEFENEYEVLEEIDARKKT